jgi:hypothetical protein
MILGTYGIFLGSTVMVEALTLVLSAASHFLNNKMLKEAVQRPESTLVQETVSRNSKNKPGVQFKKCILLYRYFLPSNLTKLLEPTLLWPHY